MIARRGRYLALVLTLVALVDGPGLSGQEGVEQQVAEPIALAWGVPEADVVLANPDGFPDRVDSVSVGEASAGRWLVTFWVDAGAVRRFTRAGRRTTVPVARRTITRGAVVDSTAVRFESRVVWDGAPPPPNPIGLVAQRRVAEGQILRHPAVRAPVLVTGGQQIEAVLSRSGVVMTVKAEALGSARAGDVVRVRLASGLRTEGRAVARGRVRLVDGGT